jgi:alkaline phosphatase
MALYRILIPKQGNRMKRLIFIALVAIIGCDRAINELSSQKGNKIQLTDKTNAWFQSSEDQLEKKRLAAERIQNQVGAAKNIILFVGDGMSLTTVTASRIFEGQRNGLLGEENNLSFDKFPFSGLAKTYAVDTQVPDSASTMTAMMSGVKTNRGIVGISEQVSRGKCETQAGNEVISALDLAELAGLSTGIVTTARVTHATPAATYAKSANRDWEDPSEMPQSAIDAGCQDIAVQLIQYQSSLNTGYEGADTDGIEVVMGGGQRHFLPQDKSDSAQSDVGTRPDGRNLVDEWKTLNPKGVYLDSRADFDATNFEEATQVLGLFGASHMRFEANRQHNGNDQPSLSEMTANAIKVLQKNSKGFFLMVEAGRIDHAHHAGNAYNALSETVEFSNAVEVALQATNVDDTLIIVTADHGHVFTMAGYPKRGNPILGKVVPLGQTKPSLAVDNLPYTTLGYANGRGHRHLGLETDADECYDGPVFAGRANLTGLDTTQPGFFQESLVPLTSETHSGEDVAIYASGPGAHLISGSNEQTIIFHVMNHAAGLVDKAERALSR